MSMVCGIQKLTQRECLAFIKKVVREKTKKALLNDGGGLYLRALMTGTASWVFRYETEGEPHEHGLGSFATFDLVEVREKARKCRQLLHEGIDPIAESQKARQTRYNAKVAANPASRTFKYCALKFIAFKEVGWRNDKHRRDWENSLERFVFPLLGNRLVSTITLDDVLAVLSPHWATTTETMMRVRGRIENILGWAGAQKPPYRSGPNPAVWKGNLDAHLNAKVRKETEHFAALGYEQIPQLVAGLRVWPDVAGDALLFTLLTAARSGETRLARWSEINFMTGVWSLAAGRMKAHVAHRVPLVDEVLDLLRRQPTYPGDSGGDGLVFCGARLRPLGETAMLERLQALWPGATVHGTVRAGFSTWCGDVARPAQEVREAALAHGKDKVVGAYQRSDFLTERRSLMQAWTTYCLAGNNIVPLRVA
jgi:integrase